MPTLDYLLPCRMSSVDARTNALSLFGILDVVSVVAPVPGRPPVYSLFPIEIATRWRQEATDPDVGYAQRLLVVDPNGTASEVAVTDFRMTSPRHRILSQLPPLRISEQGVYLFRVYLAEWADQVEWGDPLGEYAIEVVFEEAIARVRLSGAEKQRLQRDVRGQGGYQSLLRRIQSNIVGDELVLTAADAERLVRSAQAYGPGGFQERIRPIMERVKRELDQIGVPPE